MIIRALVAHQQGQVVRRLRRGLAQDDLLLTTLASSESLWDRMSTDTVDLLLASPEMLPRPHDETIRAIRALPESPEVVVLTGADDPEETAGYLAAGAVAVLSPELPGDQLREAIEALAARRREQWAPAHTAEEESRLGDFVAESPAMRLLLSLAKRVADSDTTVLLLGESGVGKEWLAKAIHAESARAKAPFVALNCGAIPEGLVESELFGHSAGAFTGADRDRRGYFELAHGGTLFLDEIVEMPVHLQVKLLRVLQDREFQRVGGEETLRTDVRIIAATNRDPALEIQSGRLREDLYYRIGVVTLTVPPLREREGDIDSLVQNYFDIFRVTLGRSVDGIDPEAMQVLREYSWPGNVRELINVMERSVLLSGGTVLRVEDLPRDLVAGVRPAGGGAEPDRASEYLHKPLRQAKREMVDAFEKRYLEALLWEYQGRVGVVARRAGITPRALFAKMKRLGLKKEAFRRDA